VVRRAWDFWETRWPFEFPAGARFSFLLRELIFVCSRASSDPGTGVLARARKGVRSVSSRVHTRNPSFGSKSGVKRARVRQNDGVNKTSSIPNPMLGGLFNLVRIQRRHGPISNNTHCSRRWPLTGGPPSGDAITAKNRFPGVGGLPGALGLTGAGGASNPAAPPGFKDLEEMPPSTPGRVRPALGQLAPAGGGAASPSARLPVGRAALGFH
jgi:hypothetical protein